jgi:hypothetical protein
MRNLSVVPSNLFIVREGTAAVHDDNEHSVKRGADRRSAWSDPRFFVPLLSQLVATIVSVTIIITVARSDISNVKEKIAELRGQVSALESLTKTTIEQKDRLDAIDARLKKVEDAVTVQQAAYNFNFTSRLVAVEVRAGIRPQNRQPKDGD